MPGIPIKLAVIILASGLFGLQAAAVEPLRVLLSEPRQTRDLMVIEIVLPAADFAEPSGGTPVLERWRVVDQSDALRELYLAAADPTGVTVYGLVQERRPALLAFHRVREGTGSETAVFTVPVRPEQAQPGPPSLLRLWAEARNRVFARYAAHSPLLGSWLQISAKAYGTAEVSTQPGLADRGAARQNNLNAFSLFSGEAAIQETLQQQVLRNIQDSQPAPQTLKDLQGPEVPSHPFEELVKGRPVEPPPIAGLVPQGRYFIQIDDPGRALAWLDRMAETGADLIDLYQQSYLNRALIDRYLARLGLSRERVKQLSPLIGQAALFGPDLYLQQGSHITLLLDAAGSAPVLSAALRLLPGLVAVDAEIPAGRNDRPVYFAQHQRWLILSSSREEAAAALKLAQAGGEGSLGRSAEFRYMLSLLPPQQDARGLLIYFSDPFIRAMVGPGIKIAQLRREQARARLHLASAGALLYQLDHSRPPVLDELLGLNYLDRSWLTSWEGDRISLDEQGIARSSLYGTLAEMTPLTDLDIGALTVGERTGYRQYVENYSRFWRTYFDPVAIRIHPTAPLRIETLILPLINNSIYDSLREMIGGEPVAIALPALTPKPVTALAVKLPRQILEQAGTGRDKPWTALLARLGDHVQVALYDNDPIITLGSADLLGSFSGLWLGGSLQGDFLRWGLWGALLTQPTTLFIPIDSRAAELDSAQWEAAFWKLIHTVDFGTNTLERLGGEDGWVYTLDAGGLLRFHLFIRRIGDYMAVSNRQMDFQAPPVAAQPQPANARLQVDFSQIRALAPTLYLRQMQRRRQAVADNIGRLLPLLWLPGATPEQAMDRYQRLYGSRPEHPPGGQWVWRAVIRELESSVFGSLRTPKLPGYYEQSPEALRTGPFRRVKTLDLRFRFEAEGIRVVLEAAQDTGPEHP